MEAAYDWSKPSEDGTIDVPDELYPFFNSLAMQMRLHKISGKNEIITLARMVQISQEFFSNHPELLTPKTK